MKIVLDPGAKTPVRAHPTDAGWDIFSKEPAIIPAKGSYTFHTGVHIQLPKGTVGFLKSKSGLNIRFGIESEGVIDEGYTGEIVVKLYNKSSMDYVVRLGDKITQLVVLPVHPIEELEIVKTLEESERGDNGFGSTGR
jgi:dUTP pyrophosphatase